MKVCFKDVWGKMTEQTQNPVYCSGGKAIK